MKDRIIELLNKKDPRTASRCIKNDFNLRKWVEDNSPFSDNFSKRIYDSLNPGQEICKNNNFKSFDSVYKGYRYCGRVKDCLCAADSISKKVSQSKLNYSLEQKININQKRAGTNLKKYGVSNVGQTSKAKLNRQKYYDSRSNKQSNKDKKTILEHSYERIKQKLDGYLINIVTPAEQYYGVSNHVYYEFQCKKCNHNFSTYIDNGHIPVCAVCNPRQPSYTSRAETSVRDFIQHTVPSSQVISSDKSIINPYELDIVIPEKQIAVEYCGLYWHSSANNKPKDYHYKKMSMSNRKGYRLVTIFEDEWMTKAEIVKSRLQNILGKSKRIYARNTQVGLVSSRHAREFLEKTHIQGYAISSINLGLYDAHTNLKAIMTFSVPRYNKKYQYEILRYSSIDTVVGGAGKLFTYFVKNYNPTSVISYCDMRWGTGKMYESIGMKLHGNSLPGYSYTDFVTRVHRSKFTKKKLLENSHAIGNTEEELARSINWYRIWDCGNSIYVWQSS